MRKRLAAPFVMTLAMSSATGGCTKPADQPPPDITKDPPTRPTPTTHTTASTNTPPAGSVIYDGYGSCYRLVDGEKKYVPKCPESLLPTVAPDAPTYAFGGHCRRVGDGQPVQCPPAGPTLITPDPSTLPGVGGVISLRYGSLTCHQNHEMKCPPGAACNPPPPTPMPCPAALLPKLSPGVKPTKVDGTRCFYQTVEVACP